MIVELRNVGLLGCGLFAWRTVILYPVNAYRPNLWMESALVDEAS